MHRDYIIVGQGLAGTVLGYLLLQSGCRIMVFDNQGACASQVAAGIYNPVTGKRMTKTWKADQLFPFMEKFYREFENKFNVQILFPKKVVKPFASYEEQNTWLSKDEQNDFVTTTFDKNFYEQYVECALGGYETNHSGYVDLPVMLDRFKNHLIKEGAIEFKAVLKEDVLISENEVTCHGFKAKKIIFCNGVNAWQDSLFSWLPFYPSKGEVLTIDIKNFTSEVIFNKQVFVLPTLRGDFKVGSTYVWDYKDSLPTATAKEEICSKLEKLIKRPYTISKQEAGIRPTVKDRRPIMGDHPSTKVVGLFNGLGTKGVSLAPYFAKLYVDSLLNGIEIEKEVNIARFYSLYSPLENS